MNDCEVRIPVAYRWTILSLFGAATFAGLFAWSFIEWQAAMKNDAAACPELNSLIKNGSTWEIANGNTTHGILMGLVTDSDVYTNQKITLTKVIYDFYVTKAVAKIEYKYPSASEYKQDKAIMYFFRNGDAYSKELGIHAEDEVQTATQIQTGHYRILCGGDLVGVYTASFGSELYVNSGYYLKTG